MTDPETIVDVAWMVILLGLILLFVVMMFWHYDIQKLRIEDDKDDDETSRHH